MGSVLQLLTGDRFYSDADAALREAIQIVPVLSVTIHDKSARAGPNPGPKALKK